MRVTYHILSPEPRLKIEFQANCQQFLSFYFSATSANISIYCKQNTLFQGPRCLKRFWDIGHYDLFRLKIYIKRNWYKSEWLIKYEIKVLRKEVGSKSSFRLSADISYWFQRLSDSALPSWSYLQKKPTQHLKSESFRALFLSNYFRKRLANK